MKSGLNEISTCEVCGNRNLVPVIDLGPHPMCDDLVEVGDTRICREYPIDILYCRTCRTAHQRYQVPKRELFPSTYHYRSRFTADVLKGMAGLVDAVEQRVGSVRGKKILDVGCNDGSLLNFFRDKGAVTFGIEPTGASLDAKQQGHTTFNEFLSEALAGRIHASYGSPDFIVFTNVFAHIEDLAEVVRSLRRLTGPQTVIVIENHYLGSVLDGVQFDTFYHEHPRTYSFTSFVHIARSLGLELSDVEFPSRYGGNIRVYLAGSIVEQSSVDRSKLDERESRFEQGFEALRENMERWRAKKKGYVREQVARSGKLEAKAFPGRAAILMKLLDLDEKSISAVYEKPGSMKIGHYIPGTRIPILSDDVLFAQTASEKPLLNLAWHISEEIRDYLARNGHAGPVVDIVSRSDFE